MYNYTIWVCVDCMLHHANGECGSCHMNMDDPYRETDAHDREPMGLIDQPMSGRETAAMGLMWDQHNVGCYNFPEGTAANWPCDCETNAYSTAACEGCGSTLHGERHAFTVWLD